MINMHLHKPGNTIVFANNVFGNLTGNPLEKIACKLN